MSLTINCRTDIFGEWFAFIWFWRWISEKCYAMLNAIYFLSLMYSYEIVPKLQQKIPQIKTNEQVYVKIFPKMVICVSSRHYVLKKKQITYLAEKKGEKK